MTCSVLSWSVQERQRTLERVQQNFMKMTKGLKHPSYKERLRAGAVFQERCANIWRVVRWLWYIVLLTNSLLPLFPKAYLTFNNYCIQPKKNLHQLESGVHQAQIRDFFSDSSDSCNFALHIFISEQIRNISWEKMKGQLGEALQSILREKKIYIIFSMMKFW